MRLLWRIVLFDMFFYVDDLKIYYKVLGEKSSNNYPILFLHGWGGSVDSFKIFENELKSKTKIIFLDFPPFGKSSKLNKVYDIDSYAKIVLSLLRKLKIKKVNIVAHSFGGRVALYLASKNCDMVNKMLLTGCAGLKRKELKIKIKIYFYKFKKLLSKLGLYPKIKLDNCGSEDYKNLNFVMKQTFNNIVNFDERIGNDRSLFPYCFEKRGNKRLCPSFDFSQRAHRAFDVQYITFFDPEILQITDESGFSYRLFYHLSFL